MVIRLMPQQIPGFWDVIKFACKEADEVRDNLQAYLNELLQALLSDKAQCWVRVDEQRMIMGLLVTRVAGDRHTGKKYLFLQCLYSFKRAEGEMWKDDFGFIREFATKNGCEAIIYESMNPAVWEIGRRLGFEEITRRFVLKGGV